MSRKGMTRRQVFSTLAGGAASCTAAGLSAVSAQAPLRLTEATALVMIEDRGCPFCARFEAEVLEGYLKSPEGRFAPLVRRPRNAADAAFLTDIIYSPTFVLLQHGQEVGRIVGYPGAELFWMQIAGLMKRAGFEPGTGG